MPPSDRKGTWNFETLWTFQRPLPTAPIVNSDFLVHIDSALRRDLMERETRPPNLRSVQLKYKPSDLEVVLNKTPMTLHVTGYIQSTEHRAVELDSLLRWFAAKWSPVNGQLGRHQPYRDWSGQESQDPAYRHVQVSGVPAVATRGPTKNKVCSPE